MGVVIVPAFRGEFGMKVRYHVPQVYALGPGHVIEIEAGEEALYPLAAEWRIVERAPDDTRFGLPKRGGREERFIPRPHVPQRVGAHHVVVCPRLRAYAPGRNWTAWPGVIESLRASGLSVFAAGAPDSSYDVQCPRSWDYARFLDATIEAMLHARLVVALDSGLAHLAVLCGRPVLIVTYRGRSGPGPVQRFAGSRPVRPQQPEVPLRHYYLDVNHAGARIELVDGWENPGRVVRRVLDLLT